LRCPGLDPGPTFCEPPFGRLFSCPRFARQLAPIHRSKRLSASSVKQRRA